MATPMPRGLLTLADWEALPEDNSAHYELQEGVLVASPRPAKPHQRAVYRLAMQIDPQLPPGWEHLEDFEVVVRAVDPAIVRAPDLMIVRSDCGSARARADEVLLAAEIISPGSRNVDTHLKSVEYAEAGIPHYWLVDLDPPAPTITVFGLGAPGDGYRESRTASAELVVREPFALRVDIAALVKTR
jgi:Uma2 family endonuclease